MQGNLKKIYKLVIFTVGLIIVLWKLPEVLNFLGFILKVLNPFIIGGIIAFIVNLPMKFFESKLAKINAFKSNKVLKKLLRPLALVISLLILGLVLLVLINIVIPQLGESIGKLTVDINNNMSNVITWIEKITNNNQEIIKSISSLKIDYKTIINQIIEFAKSGFTNALSLSISAAYSVFSVVFNLVISFIFSIYILFGKENLIRQIQKVLKAYLKEKHIKRINYIASVSNDTFSNFIAGQLKEAIILGFMFLITMNIFKMPYPLLISVLISVTALVPIFGTFIGCAVGAFLILVINPTQAIQFIILFIVLQQIEGNAIYPYVVGGSIGLPSIWVLAAVSIGGSLFGIAGIIFFIPLTSIAYRLFKEHVNKKIKRQTLIKNVD